METEEHRPLVFISHSKEDDKWLQRLLPHLKSLTMQIDFEIWDDSKIDLDGAWFERVKKAMYRARAAICLISANYLATDFVFKEEFPYLLARRLKEGLLLVPILVSPCIRQSIHWFKDFNMLPRDGISLAEMKTEKDIDRVLAEVAQSIYKKLISPEDETEKEYHPIGLGDVSGAPPVEPPKDDTISKPTSIPKMVCDQWAREDCLGYENFARSIATLITNVEKPPFSIAIRGPWGSGKTTIMKMVQCSLDNLWEDEREKKPSSESEKPDLKLPEIFQELEADDAAKEKIKVERGRLGAKWDIQSRPTIWFNVWKYHTGEQIWAGLAHAIINQITSRMSTKEEALFWLRLNAKRLDTSKLRQNLYKFLFVQVLAAAPLLIAVLLPLSLVLAAIAGISYFWSGLGGAALGVVGSVVHWLFKRNKSFRDNLAGKLHDLIREPDYEKKVGFLHLVDSDIRKVLDLIATPDRPLVVFIDDLDRCSPGKVAAVVEAINVFLSGDLPNTIFVIGMEPDMVAAAVEVANKELIERVKDRGIHEDDTTSMGWRFMEKVTQLTLVIPPPTEEGSETYKKYICGLSEETTTSEFEALVGNYAEDYATAATVTEVADLTQSLFEGAPEEDKAAIAEASKRAYSKRIQEHDPVIGDFIDRLRQHAIVNPRDIKRYVNLFRFFSALRHSVRFDRLAVGDETTNLPDDEALTKFVIMTMRWPQSAALLRSNARNRDEMDGMLQDRPSPLYRLENRAHDIRYEQEESLRSEQEEDEEQKEKEDVNIQWVKYIERIGLKPEPWLTSPSFREFLASKPLISEYEGRGLW